ncbi:unnamed protein product, partial [Brassica oleracea]
LLLRCKISEQIWDLIPRRFYTHSCFITWTSFIEWL